MHEELIKRLGGAAYVADRLRLKPNVVGNWTKRGVPWMYRHSIAALAAEKSVSLPRGFLPSLAQANPKPRRKPAGAEAAV